VPETGGAYQVEGFLYKGDSGEPAPEWTLWADYSESASRQAEEGQSQDQPAPVDFEVLLAEEKRQAFELGRQQGRQEERAAQGQALAAAEEQRRMQAVNLVERFAAERNQYFQAVEREVVRLALRIAARILRREAQIDPLLLLAVVRVALGQLAENTETRIAVPEAELAAWTQALQQASDCAVKPALVGESGMRCGDCRIESVLGAVDLSLRAQLQEIENGFFDGDGERPQALSRPERETPETEP
jgi:flagellar biosynthesis/type III secretory pathway protein FliH